MTATPRFAALPPLEQLPGPVAAPARELQDLRARRADIAARRHLPVPEAAATVLYRRDVGSNGMDPDRQAAEADARLLAEAARENRPLDGIGTPHAAALARARDAYTRDRAAVDGAIEAVEAELHAALQAHSDECRAIAAGLTETTGASYTRAVDALAQARADHLTALALDAWLDAIDNGATRVGYGTNAASAINAGSLMSLSPERLFTALRDEAARRRGRVDRRADGLAKPASR